MIEFLNFLKHSPYFNDIMDQFNKNSERLTMFVDDDKTVRIKINGENT